MNENMIKNWCAFVIDENIIPFGYKLVGENRTNIHLLSYILYTQMKDVAPDALPNEIKNISSAMREYFNSDPDTKKWLTTCKDILHALYAFSSPDYSLNMNKSIAALCYDFILNCPLVAPDAKKKYLTAQPTQHTNIPHAAKKTLKDKFAAWLANDKTNLSLKKYSYNTANSYKAAINQISQMKDIIDWLQGANLWQISDSETVEQLITELESNKEQYQAFWDKNARSNATHENALKRYAEYLEFGDK